MAQLDHLRLIRAREPIARRKTGGGGRPAGSGRRPRWRVAIADRGRGGGAASRQTDGLRRSLPPLARAGGRERRRRRLGEAGTVGRIERPGPHGPAVLLDGRHCRVPRQARWLRRAAEEGRPEEPELCRSRRADRRDRHARPPRPAGTEDQGGRLHGVGRSAGRRTLCPRRRAVGVRLACAA